MRKKIVAEWTEDHDNAIEVICAALLKLNDGKDALYVLLTVMLQILACKDVKISFATAKAKTNKNKHKHNIK